MIKDKFRNNLWLSWVGFIVIIVVWQFVSAINLINPSIFPGPIAVVEAAIRDVPVYRLLQHIGISLVRVIFGFFIGAVLGVFIGIVSGWYRKLGNVLQAPIELIRPIPPIAWIPIAIFWLGLGEASKIFIILLGSFFPIFTNTFKGMYNINPEILQAGRILGLKGIRLLFRVAFPATLPDIATGMRVGWSYSFGLMVAAELIAADSGLGYMIMHARELGQIAVIVYGVIIIGLLNLFTDFIIQQVIIKRRLKWYYIGTTS